MSLFAWGRRESDNEREWREGEREKIERDESANRENEEGERETTWRERDEGKEREWR